MLVYEDLGLKTVWLIFFSFLILLPSMWLSISEYVFVFLFFCFFYLWVLFLFFAFCLLFHSICFISLFWLSAKFLLLVYFCLTSVPISEIVLLFILLMIFFFFFALCLFLLISLSFILSLWLSISYQNWFFFSCLNRLDFTFVLKKKYELLFRFIVCFFCLFLLISFFVLRQVGK